MNEKIKNKAKEVKNWAVDHKHEIVMIVIGISIGAVSASYLKKDNIKGFDPDLISFIDSVKRMKPTNGYDIVDSRGMTFNDVRDEMVLAHTQDVVVVGALVYTKNK